MADVSRELSDPEINPGIPKGDWRPSAIEQSAHACPHSEIPHFRAPLLNNWPDSLTRVDLIPDH